MTNRISIESIEGLPRPSHELPNDQLHVRLGCAVCPYAVCFKTEGISSTPPIFLHSPHKEDVQDFDDCISDVDKMSEVSQGSSFTWDEPCIDVCPQYEDMQDAVELLNGRFGSNLQLPGQK